MIGSKVPGHGPVPAKILVCGEGPGATEAAEGRPFCGASGAELDWLYLRRAAGIRREQVYVTNVVKYRTDTKDSDPTADDITRDEGELLGEIEVVSPQIIVAVGRVAARWFLQSESVDMEKLHGTPIVCPRYPDKLLLVVYHPAAGLHQPERYSALIYWDFEQLGRLSRGEIRPLADTIVQPMYVDAAPTLQLPTWKMKTIAMDTEGSAEAPWGLSLSYYEGEAFVLRGSQGLANQTVQGAVSLSEHVVLHNALYDLPVLEKLGISVRPEQLIDTMLAAYLVPWLPRRLKALSFKLCGMEQDEYEDITREADEKISKEYLLEALSNKCTNCEGSGNVQVPYKRSPNKFKSVRCPDCKGDGTAWPQPIPQLLFDSDSAGRVYKPRSIGRGLAEILKRGADFRTGWEAVDVSLRHDVESKLGKLRATTLDDVPLDKAVHYSARDADATLRVWHVLEPLLKQEGLWKVYEIDKGIIPIIARMHRNGILIDRAHFSSLESQFSRERAACVDSLSSIANFAFNPSSPLQVSQLLYEKFKLKASRGKESTDEKTLEALKIRYAGREEVTEAINLITETRELSKLLSTYVIPLPLAADVHDRVHTRFLLHVTNTGRLASREPNLQNQPTRKERGKQIRKGFIAKEGCSLVSVDLDQIELRVAAHLSGDENMIDVFRTGKDIHRATAALIYSKPMEEITTQERLLSKTINFLILYGGSANRLQKELSLLGINVTKEQCMEFINGWFKAYPGVKDFMAKCEAQARDLGYVECMFGRRRYLPGVFSGIDKVREESIRWATNFPVQATAAGILKLWMRGVWEHVIPAVARLGYCEPLLTVHDEIILEVSKGLEDLLIGLTVQEAADCVELAVPVGAKGAAANDWGGLK